MRRLPGRGPAAAGRFGMTGGVGGEIPGRHKAHDAGLRVPDLGPAAGAYPQHFHRFIETQGGEDPGVGIGLGIEGNTAFIDIVSLLRFGP